MTDDAVGFICAYVEWFETTQERKPAVLAFGMGASTLFFIDRVSDFLSFGHHPDRYKRVVQIAETLGMAHPRTLLAERLIRTRSRPKRLVGATI